MKHLIVSISLLASSLVLIANTAVMQLEFVKYVAIGLIALVAILRKPKEISDTVLAAIPRAVKFSYYFLIAGLLLVVIAGMLEGILKFDRVLLREMAFEIAISIGLLAASLEAAGKYALLRKETAG